MATQSWAEQGIELRRTSRFVIRSRVTTVAYLPADASSLNQLIDSAEPDSVLKNDRTTTVVRLKDRLPALILKRYNPRSHWHKIKRAFRLSRARNCWTMSFAFQRAGLNVSPPVMMFEERVALIRKDAYFANEWLDGEELLTSLPDMSDDQQAMVKNAVCAAFDKLAMARISHGDMKASNLLWVDNELFFIDLDAARQHPRWSLTWKRKHAKDKRRFLKNWQNHPELINLFIDL